MNYHDRVLKVVKETHLNEILNLIPNDKKEIYFIGGVSRAIILDEYYSKDVDIVLPDFDDKLVENLSKNFETKYFPSYKSIAIKTNNFEYQINSFRRDIQSTGRHSKVTSTRSIRDDSERRDFTFNSVYINLLGEAIDFYGGIDDLHNYYLRFIFDPIDQIQKDYLRALRYVRFLSLFKQPKTNPHDIDSLILLSKNITEFVKTKKISQELNKIHKMPYPENTLNFLKTHKELNSFLDYL
jgi:tRNA nucleotidyltransferase/poly(A) polymerase|tara:strand:- start:1122 stop:1841 length:720 start_codon:yes stop_codon:yes gene_type:complete